MQRPTDLPSPGTTVDDFLLIDRLGQGSFAEVYLARQVSLQRTVALKISADLGHEPATLAQLDHPHIVRVFDQRAVPERGWRLLYMEHIAGGTLEDIVARVRSTPPAERNGRLLLDGVDAALRRRAERPPTDSLVRRELAGRPWGRAVAGLGADLAEALQHAHDQGVLHRDVKPANVLLAANAEAKLADFNISHAATIEGDHAAEHLGGSVAYMPAEQLRALSPFHEESAEDLDGRADLYALGVLLVELLTGDLPWPERPPPADGDWRAWFDAMLEDRRNAAATLALPPGTPPSLVEALRACLAFAPEDRPADGRTLARRLRLALHPRAERHVEASRAGWRRAACRRPALSVLLVTALPSVVLGVLNVAYNLRAVIDRDATWAAFETQVAAVNAVAYGAGLGLLHRLARPLRQALVAARAGRPRRAVDLEGALRLPHRAACVVLPLWIVGGLAFPTWRALEGTPASAMAWLHFGASNALFGVLAATAAFFNVASLVVVGCLPTLLARPPSAGLPLAPAARLERRSRLHFGCCVAVPFASVIVTYLMAHETQAIYLILGLLGFVAFGLAWLQLDLVRATLHDLRAAFPEGAAAEVAPTEVTAADGPPRTPPPAGTEGAAGED